MTFLDLGSRGPYLKAPSLATGGGGGVWDLAGREMSTWYFQPGAFVASPQKNKIKWTHTRRLMWNSDRPSNTCDTCVTQTFAVEITSRLKRHLQLISWGTAPPRHKTHRGTRQCRVRKAPLGHQYHTLFGAFYRVVQIRSVQIWFPICALHRTAALIDRFRTALQNGGAPK